MYEIDKHYSPDLENSILGACMLETSAFARIFDVVKPEMFYSTENIKVFEVISEMFEENIPIDLVTVATFLIRTKGIKDFNGENVPYALSKKTTIITSTAHLEYHAILLKQMWLDREILRLTLGGVNAELDGFEQLSKIQDKIRELTTTTGTNDWKDMSELMIGLYKHQDEMIATGGMGVACGFESIDKLYGGFHAGQMIVIAARPSVGKSAFAGQIALNMAMNGSRVGIVSLEMNNNEIAARLASLDTGLDFRQIFRGLYADENDREKFYQKVNSSTSNLPIWVSDKADVNMIDIKAKAYKLKSKHGLDCIVVDYLQLVGSDSNVNRNRENEVAKISRGFKIIAKELNVPLIVLAQLNREVDKRKGKDRFPQLSDLRESGAIEQDGDVVMFLHSDFKSGLTEDENGYSTENRAHLVIRKWRNGQSNLIIDLDFDGPRMKFSEAKAIPGYKPLNNQF